MKLEIIFTGLLLAVSFVFGAERKLYFHPFDTVHVYQSKSPDSEVVLFISGDGGWNLGVIEMARQLAGLGATVVGVDIVKYIRKLNTSQDKCVFPAGDFEVLSKFIQQKLKYPRYVAPIIVGYSSGATLAYALIAQAPAGTFKGAISMGFCPDLPLVKPPCTGSGLEHIAGPRGSGFSFLPKKDLQAPWIAFQGLADQVCSPDTVNAFVSKTGNAEVVALPKVGHGFSVEKNWLPQFKQAYLKIIRKHAAESPVQVAADVSDVSGLPLVEVPATGGSLQGKFAVILSGDGGWAGIDQGIAKGLAAAGIPVVGWNSLQYFWTRRSPEQVSVDLGRIINHYLQAWKKEKVILIGYSFGADVMPFCATRLDKELLSRVSNIAFLGLSDRAEFEFHIAGWIGGVSQKAMPTMPEIKKLNGKPMLYIYGTEEKDNVAGEIDTMMVKVVSLPGGHHYNGKFDVVAQNILANVGK